MSTAEQLPVVVGVADEHPVVLDFARAEAQRASCGLRVVHAYVVPPSAMGSVYGLDVPESFRAGAQEVVDEAVRHLRDTGPVPPIEPVVQRGFAPKVLEAEADRAAMLVIGPDADKPWYFHMFEGRVAHHLVEHAKCPVVVVPDSWSAEHDDGAVVVMLDGAVNSHGPLAFAFATAADRGAELQILHVEPDATPDDAERRAIERVADAWFAAHRQVRGSLRVARGDVQEAAAEVAGDAGLLVLGRPRERRALSRRMDSLAQDVIAVAGCPVAVVPAEYRG